MNQKDYVMKNLNMISRFALLENAKRTRNSIDSLIMILRYMEEDSKGDISTIAEEIKIVNKLFFLFKEKKGDGFSGMIIDETNENHYYIQKGMVIEFLDMALCKKQGKNQSLLEVKVIVKPIGSGLKIIIQDNGDIEKSMDEQYLEPVYEQAKALYESEQISLSIHRKRNIGTTVNIVIQDENIS